MAEAGTIRDTRGSLSLTLRQSSLHKMLWTNLSILKHGLVPLGQSRSGAVFKAKPGTMPTMPCQQPYAHAFLTFPAKAFSKLPIGGKDLSQQTFIGGDGRKLCYSLTGHVDPRAQVVLYHHTLGGSRLDAHYPEMAALRLGVLLVTLDRPGYGGTAASAGDNLAVVARDTGSLVQHLGLKDYYLLGDCVGLRYALANASSLPKDQIKGIALVGDYIRFNIHSRDRLKMSRRDTERHDDYRTIYAHMTRANQGVFINTNYSSHASVDGSKDLVYTNWQEEEAQKDSYVPQVMEYSVKESALETQRRDQVRREASRRSFPGIQRDLQMILQERSLYQDLLRCPLDKVTPHTSTADSNEERPMSIRYWLGQRGLPERVYPAAKYWNILRHEVKPILAHLFATGTHWIEADDGSL